jgi:hypothetical protein
MNLWCGFMLALVAGARTASAARQPGGVPSGAAANCAPRYGAAHGTTHDAAHGTTRIAAIGSGARAGTGSAAAEPEPVGAGAGSAAGRC